MLTDGFWWRFCDRKLKVIYKNLYRQLVEIFLVLLVHETVQKTKANYAYLIMPKYSVGLCF
jgi:hypothetical protein